MVLIGKVFLFVIRRLALLIDYIIPKNSNIIIFGSNGANAFNGNPLAIYNKLKDYGNFQLYYITKNYNSSDPNELNDRSFKTLYILMRAKTYIVSHGWSDFGQFWGKVVNNSRHVKINTWHGYGLKNDCNNNKLLKGKERINTMKYFKSVDYFISCSSFFSYIIASEYFTDYSKCLETGFPRNDVIFRSQNTKNILSKYFPNAPNYKNVLLYAPTFREEGTVEFFPFEDFNLEILNNYLEEENILLLLRGHRNDDKSIDIFQSPRILDFNFNIESDINSVLNCFDLLITDYSSIALDFLLLDRPLVFIPYDLDSYNRGRGVYPFYGEITPGDKVFTFKSFLLSLHTNLSGHDQWSEKRLTVKKLCYAHIDDKSTIRFIDILIDKNIIQKRV